VSKCRKIIYKLHSFNNKEATQALDELRERGCLADGTLNNIDLRHGHLQNANLACASLLHVNLSMVDLRWADLYGADLESAQLNNSNLYRSNMDRVNLSGASLIKTNLQDVQNLNENELGKAHSLRGSTMPDGSIYDGFFSLQGDLQMAVNRNIDPGDVEAMAEFYGVSEPYHWAISDNTWLPDCNHTELILRLHAPDNEAVAYAVEGLRMCGRLSNGFLKNLNFRFAHMQGIDLSTADLTGVNLCFADLRGVNLSYAHLVSANLHKANFRGANFELAELQDAALSNSILQGARNLSENHLIQTSCLRGAMMPDGSRYDGRYNLIGDATEAFSHGFDIEDSLSLSDFYGISLEDYQHGQSWVHYHLPDVWARKERLYLEDMCVFLAHPHPLQK